MHSHFSSTVKHRTEKTKFQFLQIKNFIPYHNTFKTTELRTQLSRDSFQFPQWSHRPHFLVQNKILFSISLLIFKKMKFELSKCESRTLSFSASKTFL